MPGDAQPPESELHTFTATQLVDAIASGITSCVEVARACLERIEAREPEVRAWQHLEPELAMATARELDRRGPGGALHGVPIGVKDIIDTHDMPTEWGTPIHKGFRPPQDAICVALSRRAGALVLGKTVTTEFANVTPGPTRHPDDPTRTPGGSSSGSAAAVADRMVPLAMGTQTTGSTIRPASYCGVFGHRPTFGDLPMIGVMEVAGSLDTLGIMARSIDDVVLFRDVLSGVEPSPVGRSPSPIRIGFCRPYFWSRLAGETRGLLEDAADRLAGAGATVGELTLPDVFSGLEEAHRWISGFEMTRNLPWEIENRWDEISVGLRVGRLKDGLECSSKLYREMQERAATGRRLLGPLIEEFDVLLAPAAAGEAPEGWDPVPDPWVHTMWTVLHVPSVTVPVFTGSNGLPIGLQLIGHPHQDRALLAAAKWVGEVLA